MDDGERRYYYKGGGGNPDLFENLDRKHGAVCLIRNLDEDWLNGYRQNNMPIILEDSHMEGILITRVQDRLFMQLTLFGPPRKWVTYTSDSQDGIHWKLIGGAHRPKKNENYPMSIGVYPTVNPKWGMGQFPTEDGYIGLGYIKIL